MNLSHGPLDDFINANRNSGFLNINRYNTTNSNPLETNPNFIHFNQRFSILKEAFRMEDVNSETFAESMIETNNAFKEVQELPEAYVKESEMIPFIFNVINRFDNRLIHNHAACFILLALNRSKVSIHDFLAQEPLQFIQEIFTSEESDVLKTCYGILAKLSDCLEGCIYCYKTGLHIAIISKGLELISYLPLKGENDAKYKELVGLSNDLFNSIIRFPKFFDNEAMESSKAYFMNFSQAILYNNNQEVYCFAPYAIIILIYFAKDPFYKEIIESGLFKAAMNFIENPTATKLVLNLATKILYLNQFDIKKVQSIITLIPIDKIFDLFSNPPKEEIIPDLLTFMINTLQFCPEEVKALTSDQGIEKLDGFLSSLNIRVQQNAIWCCWCLLRLCKQSKIYKLLSQTELISKLVDITFDYDSLDFIRSALIPTIMKIKKDISANGSNPELLLSFLESIREPLISLSYNDSKEIQSLALSCLKEVFPDSYAMLLSQ